MSSRSLFSLAMAAVAIAQSSPGCGNLASVTELLQADVSYCSAVLDLGTVTNTLVESTTILETTTITTPSEVTITSTSTETAIISSGTITETAPLFLTTSTSSTTTTAYACDASPFRRDLDGQLAPYNMAMATSSTEPTSSLDEWEYEDCEDEDEELGASPVAYDAHSIGAPAVHSASAPARYDASQSAAYDPTSMDPSAVYPASVATAYVASPSTYLPMSSYVADSTGSSHARYPQASGNASTHYPSGTISSSTASSEWHPQASGNSTIPRPTGLIGASHGLSATSVNSTTPIVSSTPTPAPFCDTAPSLLRSGYSCDTLSAACGCLGLSSASEDLTSTTTFTEVLYTTEAVLVTTVIELTETVFLTVPAFTLTFAPTSTVTESALVTETSCPCSGSTSSLCGSTPDTCKDLQNDTGNCGSCGNICASGETCSAGTCVAPAVPDAPSCAASSCYSFIPCGANESCVCAATPEGSGVCVLGSTPCSSPMCTQSSDCGPEEKCAINSCCGHGICIKPQNACANTGSASRMFKRKSWDGETLGGI